MPTRLCCAYLRVYQPIEALSDSERALVDEARTETKATASRSPFGLLDAHECLEVYERVSDGQRLVCLAHTHLRTLLGLVAFERSLPESVVPLFFSRKELARAHAELETIQQAEPGPRPAIVQSVWHVPPRWFVCFDDAERRIEQAGDHPSIRYETPIATARERVAEALQTLSGGIVHPAIVGMIYELKEWLSMFDAASLLELDYASVATLFDPDELADDHSAADVWSAIRALGEGDGMKAMLYYQRVNERWTRERARASLN